MSESLTGIVPTDDEFAQDIANFVGFLNDEAPPLFIAGSLTSLLRTEPPVRFGVHRVAEIVSEWATDRSAKTGERVSDLLLLAVRNIIAAYGVNAIEHFTPKDFYRPFVSALGTACPPEERDGFQIALRTLQSADPQRAAIRSTADYGGASDAAFAVGGNFRGLGFDDLVARLGGEDPLSDDEFDNVTAALRTAILDRGPSSSVLEVERILPVAIALFNAEALDRAATLFGAVADFVERPDVPLARRVAVRRAHRSAELDERLLVTSAADPARAEQLAPVVRCLADVSPDALVGRLSTEKDPAQTRFLLSLLELHGPAAHAAILTLLESAGGRAPDTVIPLLRVLTHVSPPTDATQRRATSAVGPLVTSGDPQVRAAALTALAHVDPEGAVPHVLKALEQSSYGPIAADVEGLRAHLEAALDYLARSKTESTVAVVAEYATGGRTGDFKLGRALKDMAVAALRRHAMPLPRRAAIVVANALEETNGRKFKLVFGSFALGVDPASVALLFDLLEGSSEPEAQAMLANQALRKLAGKA